MRRLLIIVVFGIPLLVNGQGNTVQDLIATSSSRNPSLATARMQNFLKGFKTKQSLSDVALLKKVFHKTQREFLHEFRPYQDFADVFESGRYDCLTATALYSLVLDALDFNYRIIETNYHIFLLVKTSKGEILLETTDRYNGFVRNSREISQRIGSYRTTPVFTKDQYSYNCDLYDEVNPGLLPGLLYYNQAVRAFNAGNLERCGELLSRARSIYNTPRITELSSILLKSVVESRLDDATKLRIIRQFKGLVPVKSPVLASR